MVRPACRKRRLKGYLFHYLNMNTKRNQGPESPADLQWSQGAKNPRMQNQNRANDVGTLSSDTTNHIRRAAETPYSEIYAACSSSSGPSTGDTTVKKIPHIFSVSKRRRINIKRGLLSGLQRGNIDENYLKMTGITMHKLKTVLAPKHKWYVMKLQKKKTIFNRVMNDPLLVAILTGNSRSGNFTKEQSDLVIAKLTKNISDVPRNEITPRFNDFSLTTAGTLLISCFDAETFYWLAQDNFDDLWFAGTAHPVSRLDFLPLIKVRAFVPDLHNSPKVILELMRRQNVKLDTHKYRILDKSHSVEGVNLTLGLNMDLMKQLQELDMRPYYGISRIKFEADFSTSTKVSSTEKASHNSGKNPKYARNTSSAVEKPRPKVSGKENPMNIPAEFDLFKRNVLKNRTLRTIESDSSKHKSLLDSDFQSQQIIEDDLKTTQQLSKQHSVERNAESLIPKTFSVTFEKHLETPSIPRPEYNRTSLTSNRDNKRTNYINQIQDVEPSTLLYSQSSNYNEKRYGDTVQRNHQNHHAPLSVPCPEYRKEQHRRSKNHSFHIMDQIPFAESSKSPTDSVALSRDNSEFQYPPSDYDIVYEKAHFDDRYEHPDFTPRSRDSSYNDDDSRSSFRRNSHRKEYARTVTNYVSRRDHSRDREHSRNLERFRNHRHSREFREHSREPHECYRERNLSRQRRSRDLTSRFSDSSSNSEYGKQAVRRDTEPFRRGDHSNESDSDRCPHSKRRCSSPPEAKRYLESQRYHKPTEPGRCLRDQVEDEVSSYSDCSRYRHRAREHARSACRFRRSPSSRFQSNFY